MTTKNVPVNNFLIFLSHKRTSSSSTRCWRTCI